MVEKYWWLGGKDAGSAKPEGLMVMPPPLRKGSKEPRKGTKAGANVGAVADPGLTSPQNFPDAAAAGTALRRRGYRRGKGGGSAIRRQGVGGWVGRGVWILP